MPRRHGPGKLLAQKEVVICCEILLYTGVLGIRGDLVMRHEVY